MKTNHHWTKGIRPLFGIYLLGIFAATQSTGMATAAANLKWTVSSSSITDGGGTWNQGSASLPSGAPWFNGSTYGNTFNSGDNVFFGGGITGSAGIITNNTVVNPGNMTFTNGGSAVYTMGAGSSNAIVMSGGNITNNPSVSGSLTFNAPLNGSFNYYSPSTRQMVLLADGTQTSANTVTIISGYIQLGSNSGHGSLGSANIINNANMTWRRGGNFSVTSAMSGSGKIQYQLNGSVCTVNAPQTQTGYTLFTLTGAGGGSSKLTIGGNNMLSTNSDFIINQFGGNTANYAALDLNGYNQAFTSIASDVNATAAIAIITNSSATASILTLRGGSKITFFNGLIAGQLSLLLNGINSTLTLSNANTYTGNTILNVGKLALSGSGAISNTPSISVGPGATLDVSGLTMSTFNLSSSTTLNVIGNVSASAIINGQSGGSINLGTQPINLSFIPTAFSGDATHPALTISNATLVLNNNPLIVTNAAATALDAGNYLLATNLGNNITSSGSYAVTVAGTGLVAGSAASIQVTGGGLYLVVNRPMEVTMTVAITAGLNLIIPLADVATNWSSSSGYTVSLAGVTLLTTNGVTLTTNNTSIFYQAKVTASDQISYTITDGHGGTAPGLINIVINTNGVSGQTSGSISVSGGVAMVGFAGIPGYTYYVQRTPSLSPTVWSTIATNVAPSNGVFQFVDTNAPGASAFYQLSTAP